MKTKAQKEIARRVAVEHLDALIRCIGSHRIKSEAAKQASEETTSDLLHISGDLCRNFLKSAYKGGVPDIGDLAEGIIALVLNQASYVGSRSVDPTEAKKPFTN